MNEALRYAGGVLKRAVGVEAFQRSFSDLRQYNRRDSDWTIAGVSLLPWGPRVVLPAALRHFDRPIQENPILNYRDNKNFGIVLLVDILQATGIATLALFGHPVEAAILKTAYNGIAEVVPDALRAVRRNFLPRNLAI